MGPEQQNTFGNGDGRNFGLKGPHNPTCQTCLKPHYSSVSDQKSVACSYSRQSDQPHSQRIINQKHRRWQQRIIALVDIARVIDLPMTQALTINWEQICGAKDTCKAAQTGFLRRLQRRSKGLGFELAYIWINASGTKVGLHAHMMLFWPQRHSRYLKLELQTLTPKPAAVHMQAIHATGGHDYNWGHYLADHIVKHAYYSPDRNFGYSRNLRA